MTTSRLYVGIRRSDRAKETLRSRTVPTEETHGAAYLYTIGPFRTLRAARLCVSGDYPAQLCCVSGYEAAARLRACK